MPKAPKKRYCSDGTCRHAYCKGLRAGVEKGFTLGYAVAEVVRSHGQATVAADVASAAGFTIRDYLVSGLGEYDLKTLRKLRREERAFPTARAR